MLTSSWQFLNEMETEGIDANVQTFGAMIDGCARAGDVPKAFGIYKKMLNQVLNIKSAFTRNIFKPSCFTGTAVKIV